MIRSEILREIAPILRDQLVVCNIGLPSQELHMIDDNEKNFYMLGTMGLSSSIGFGLALAQDKTVISIDGDGSVLTNLGTLPTIANNVTDNFDNYTKLPGGLIIQWGHIYDTSNPRLVTFPTTFPNAVHSVVCSTNRNSSGSSGYNHVYDYSRSKASLILDASYGFWVAFGY